MNVPVSKLPLVETNLHVSCASSELFDDGIDFFSPQPLVPTSVVESHLVSSFTPNSKDLSISPENLYLVALISISTWTLRL